MRRMFMLCLGIGVLTLLPLAAYAADQTINGEVDESASLIIDPGTPITMELTAIGMNGGQPTVTNTTTGLMYTVISAFNNNHVTVETASTLPTGTRMKVVATAPGVNAQGTNKGTPAATVTIGAVAADVLTAIGSCYTGTATGTDGARLTYTFEAIPASMGTVVPSASAPLTITYTYVLGS